MQPSPRVRQPVFSDGPAMHRIALLLCAGAVAGSDALADEAPHQGEVTGHTLGVFVGDTTTDRREGLTLGAEYEYRFSSRYGAGLVLEHAWGDVDASVAVATAAYHSQAWKFYAGPGVEDSDEGTEPLLRLGIEYGLHVGEFEISPQVDVDFVEGEQLFVIGVVFARHF